MRILSFITAPDSIYKILDHLGQWNPMPSRAPPIVPEDAKVEYEPLYDDLMPYNNDPYISVN